MKKQNIDELYYIKKDYSELKEILKNSFDARSFNILGKIYLEEMNLQQAYKYFHKAGDLFECGYCYFLNGNLEEALKIFNQIKNLSPAVNWNIFLIDLVNNGKNSSHQPTYFQIRNFYEQDLENLFKAEKFEYIKKIIKSNDYLSNFNKEIYKYTGRVLFYNNYIETANKFFKKSLDICYIDPETHFLMGELYLQMQDIKKVKKSFEKANEVNNGYAPALTKLKNI